jgi:hypothetical protein
VIDNVAFTKVRNCREHSCCAGAAGSVILLPCITEQICAIDSHQPSSSRQKSGVPIPNRHFSFGSLADAGSGRRRTPTPPWALAWQIQPACLSCLYFSFTVPRRALRPRMQRQNRESVALPMAPTTRWGCCTPRANVGCCRSQVASEYYIYNNLVEFKI